VYEELLKLDTVLGVVRFDVHPAFSEPAFHTFIYGSDAVVVATFVRGCGLWDCLFGPAGELPAEWLERVVPWLGFQIPAYSASAPLVTPRPGAAHR